MTDLGKLRQIIDEIDRDMTHLFEQRMDAVSRVAEYKANENCPVEDSAREQEMIERNRGLIQNEAYRPHYTRFLQSVMAESKAYQCKCILDNALSVRTSHGEYPVHILRGGLHRAAELFNLDRKVLVVTDTGVPESYGMTVASQCAQAVVFVFDQGESSKTMDTYMGIMDALVANEFTRTDCIVAVGGGVVGDMAGFAAATYMRGIDFYNIPTTLLSQVDSSIGGKTAVDYKGYKNLAGAFYPPKGVLVDADVLSTLAKRHIRNGLAESIKMAVTLDEGLFCLLESADINDDSVLDQVILRSLTIKKAVVEADERESGKRKVLNFGHTLGHGIESVYGMKTYYHGECVALGMLPMCAPAVRERLMAVLEKVGLPVTFTGDPDKIIKACRHDKKMSGDTVCIVTVPQVGQYELENILFAEYEMKIREVLEQ